DHPSRFHLVEVSVPAFDSVLAHLTQLDLDFLLIPGDLTQHGESVNHKWLQNRLSQLPFPSYVIPGNHDIPVLMANEQSIGFADFPYYYQEFGYENPQQHYYNCQIFPGVRLIALNSNSFNDQGQQIGRLDHQQFQWLKGELAAIGDDLVLVMIHHNVVE
ncbi:MAG: metallophosphoesterase family protein, partial [Dolichospermum sp.]